MCSKTIWAWTAIGMWTLLAHFSGGSWWGLLLLAILCYCVMKLLPENMVQFQNRREYCIAQLIGIYLLLTQLIPMSALYWPGKLSEKVVPATLVLLAAYSCIKKPERVAGILFCAIAILNVPIVVAGFKDMKLEWIMPEGNSLSVWVIVALVLPQLTGFIVEERIDKWYKWIILLGTAIWMITSGLLSSGVASKLEVPLREVGKSLTLGTYSRFESVVSVAMTLGWYALTSLLFFVAVQCCKGLNIKKEAGICILAILVLTNLLTDVKISPAITVIYVVLTWILLPIFELKKISKKSEKST